MTDRPSPTTSRWTAPALAALAVVLAWTYGCDDEAAKKRDGVLRMTVPGQPANLDPNKAYDAVSNYMLTQMHEGLTRHTSELNPEPALAASWEFNEDYTEITYTLRPDIKWSDGQPLTAQDFEYSWKRLLDPATAAEYAYFLYDIRGAEAYNSGKGSAEEVAVEAVDDRTLRVGLKRPVSYFPHITTFMVTYPVRRDVVEAHGGDWIDPDNIVVSGPFVPTEWIHEYKMTLEPNPHYELSSPHMKRLEIYTISEKATALNLFVTGKADIVLDMLPIAIPEFRGKPTYHNGPKLEVRYIGYRVDKGPIKKLAVRRALAMSIQREEIPAILKGGELTTKTWLPKGMFGHNADIGIGYDPKRARELLAEAGYPGGEGFPEVTLLFRAGEDWRLVAENLQEQWKRELGIEIEIEMREQKAFFQAIDGEDPPPMHLARWIADFPDPENFMGLFKSNSGNNSLGFASQQYDELVDEAVIEADEERRREMYDAAQRIMLEEEVAMAPLYTGAQNILRRPELEGLEFNAMDFIYLRDVRWQGEGK